jgi:hypothetical protein
LLGHGGVSLAGGLLGAALLFSDRPTGGAYLAAAR